jgi:signal transduction histidine kinase
LFDKILQKNLNLTPKSKLYRRAYLILAVQFVVAFVLTFYIIFNLLVTKLYVLMSLEIISLFFTFVSWYLLVKKKNIQLSSTILLYTIFILTLLFFFDQKDHDYALAQAVMFPVICIYLKGFKWGTLYSIGYLLIVLGLAFTGIDTWEAVPFTATSFTNLTFTFIVVTLVIYYYEFSRAEAFDIIEKSNKELNDYKNNLELKVEKALEEKHHQEAILIQQSKMAMMGEMIASIAHQWKQPLSTTASIIQAAKMRDQISGKISPESDETYDKVLSQVEFMDQTISDFSNFFKPKTEYEFFALDTSISDVRKIVQPQLKKHEISIETDDSMKGFIAEGYRNEFSQVLLNIITNAKDAIVENIDKGGISKGQGKIKIRADFESNHINLCICDNGGGISEENLKNIFDPYFTTKPENLGTGIGLYMSKIIMDTHMQGTIIAENYKDGICFCVSLRGIKKQI